jgi:hypothetical protein
MLGFEAGFGLIGVKWTTRGDLAEKARFGAEETLNLPALLVSAIELGLHDLMATSPQVP